MNRNIDVVCTRGCSLSDRLKVLPSVCALDCPDTCALHITVDGDRVIHLAGDPEHPITRGFACVKTARYPERQEQPDRLLHPLRRVGRKGEGRFEPVSWDEALDAIADRVREILHTAGPQSILPYHYAGTMGVIQGDSPRAFFRALGSLELDQTICATTGGAGWEANYGPNKLSTDPEDVVHARTIILWGINTLRSNSHLAPILKEARKRGARLLHIDPYRNETSRFCDAHWQIRVGTDAALALAIGGEILRRSWHDREYVERYALGIEDYMQACNPWPLDRAAEYCDVPLTELEQLVHDMASRPPCFIKVGYGLTRNEGGGNAMRAITLLPALLGSWKQRGGGGALSTSGAFQLHRDAITGKHLQNRASRHVNMNCLGQELAPESSRIQGLFVFNSNPAAVAPDSSAVRRGLAREDLFTVVLEHFQTDTADYADYLLPATTFLEHADVYTAYGHYYLQYAEPVVSPRGQAKPNRWVFQEIARRLGLTDPCLYWDTDALLQEMLRSPNPWLEGITPERLKAERSIKLMLPEPFLPYAEGSHYEDGKIRFSPPPRQLEFQEQPNDEYPLRLISPPGAVVVNTTMGNVPSILKLAGGEPCVLVHPDDAKRYGIRDSERASIASAQGSIERKVTVTDETRPGVVIAVGQWWPKLAPDRKSLNDLTSQRLTDLGGGSMFGNAIIRIAPLSHRQSS
ncbi:MAG: molybdopterin-dependent oxidoreductase [Planctomycetota bacterium]